MTGEVVVHRRKGEDGQPVWLYFSRYGLPHQYGSGDVFNYLTHHRGLSFAAAKRVLRPFLAQTANVAGASEVADAWKELTANLWRQALLRAQKRPPRIWQGQPGLQDRLHAPSFSGRWGVTADGFLVTPWGDPANPGGVTVAVAGQAQHVGQPALWFVEAEHDPQRLVIAASLDHIPALADWENRDDTSYLVVPPHADATVWRELAALVSQSCWRELVLAADEPPGEWADQLHQTMLQANRSFNHLPVPFGDTWRDFLRHMTRPALAIEKGRRQPSKRRLDGLIAVPVGGGVRYAWAVAVKRTAFWDLGDRLHLATRADQTVNARALTAALILAEQKGWRELRVIGNQAFQTQVAKLIQKTSLTIQQNQDAGNRVAHPPLQPQPTQPNKGDTNVQTRPTRQTPAKN